MSWLPTFTAGQFAAAGALLALGPVAIHLLNRRRFRVLQWAAMDFLREALQRNRRILQLRDLLLLLLRTACVLLFGLALAQPFWSNRSTELGSAHPLHAVLVIDNSMSMGYETLGTSSIARAQERAHEYIDTLPVGSRITVLPLCGMPGGVSLHPYRTPEAAKEAVSAIEVVDRSGDFSTAANLANEACDAVTELAKRIVFFSDQQRRVWESYQPPAADATMPSVQVVDVGEEDVSNTWVSNFWLQDGLADTDSETTFVVEVSHRGKQQREDVQVTLTVDDIDVATQTVTLGADQSVSEVIFRHRFDLPEVTPGEPVLVPVSASITSDRLPVDDVRYLVVPVVAALPVVFADELGPSEEDPSAGKLGETFYLRQLLAPVTSRQASVEQLIKVRHVAFDQLSDDRAGRDLLKDARLVVIAGVEDPLAAMPLLRGYVQQGGQLFLAAGGDFDPVAWNESAWLDGAGILPAPLGAAIGALPDIASAANEFFQLDFSSLRNHAYFRLAGEPDDYLRDLFSEALFFQAIETNLDEETRGDLRTAETQRLTAQYEEMAQLEQTVVELTRRQQEGEALSAEETASLDEAQQRIAELRPQWLLWADEAGSVSEFSGAGETSSPAERAAEEAERTLPRVLARFDHDDVPFLIERWIGNGRVIFCTSGVRARWNTVPKTHVVFIFDRILRDLLQSTLPPRNFSEVDQIALPLNTNITLVTYTLARPGDEQAVEELDAGFLDARTQGVIIRDVMSRGVYRVYSHLGASEDEISSEESRLQTIFSVNGGGAEGDTSESDLTPISRNEFAERFTGDQLAWVGPGETISLSGSSIRGHNSWWWLVLLVLVLLLVEIGVLAWPSVRERHSLAQSFVHHE